MRAILLQRSRFDQTPLTLAGECSYFVPSLSTHCTDTIGKLKDGDYKLGAHCAAPGCNHHGWLDLEMLAQRLGRDRGSMHRDLVPYLRCSRCGSKNVSITLHPPTQSMDGGETAWMVPPARRAWPTGGAGAVYPCLLRLRHGGTIAWVAPKVHML